MQNCCDWKGDGGIEGDWCKLFMHEMEDADWFNRIKRIFLL